MEPTSQSSSPIVALLEYAESAHGAYETTALGGQRDEEWPAWYATYLLEHGLADHISGARSIDVDELAALLARLAADYEREQPKTPWPVVYAQRIVEELG